LRITKGREAIAKTGGAKPDTMGYLKKINYTGHGKISMLKKEDAYSKEGRLD